MRQRRDRIPRHQRVLAHRSFAHLCLVFTAYEKKSKKGLTFEQAVHIARWPEDRGRSLHATRLARQEDILAPEVSPLCAPAALVPTGVGRPHVGGAEHRIGRSGVCVRRRGCASGNRRAQGCVVYCRRCQQRATKRVRADDRQKEAHQENGKRSLTASDGKQPPTTLSDHAKALAQRSRKPTRSETKQHSSGTNSGFVSASREPTDVGGKQSASTHKQASSKVDTAMTKTSHDHPKTAGQDSRKPARSKVKPVAKGGAEVSHEQTEVGGKSSRKQSVSQKKPASLQPTLTAEDWSAFTHFGPLTAAEEDALQTLPGVAAACASGGRLDADVVDVVLQELAGAQAVTARFLVNKNMVLPDRTLLTGVDWERPVLLPFVTSDGIWRLCVASAGTVEVLDTYLSRSASGKGVVRWLKNHLCGVVPQFTWQIVWASGAVVPQRSVLADTGVVLLYFAFCRVHGVAFRSSVVESQSGVDTMRKRLAIQVLSRFWTAAT